MCDNFTKIEWKIGKLDFSDKELNKFFVTRYAHQSTFHLRFNQNLHIFIETKPSKIMIVLFATQVNLMTY